MANVIVNKTTEFTIKRFRDQILKEAYLTKFQNYKVMGAVYRAQAMCGNDLFENHKPDPVEGIVGIDVTRWDTDYFAKVYKNLTKNFSAYRLFYLREIALYVFGE